MTRVISEVTRRPRPLSPTSSTAHVARAPRAGPAARVGVRRADSSRHRAPPSARHGRACRRRPLQDRARSTPGIPRALRLDPARRCTRRPHRGRARSRTERIRGRQEDAVIDRSAQRRELIRRDHAVIERGFPDRDLQGAQAAAARSPRSGSPREAPRAPTATASSCCSSPTSRAPSCRWRACPRGCSRSRPISRSLRSSRRSGGCSPMRLSVHPLCGPWAGASRSWRSRCAGVHGSSAGGPLEDEADHHCGRDPSGVIGGMPGPLRIIWDAERRTHDGTIRVPAGWGPQPRPRRQAPLSPGAMCVCGGQPPSRLRAVATTCFADAAARPTTSAACAAPSGSGSPG